MARDNITHIEWLRKKLEENDSDVLEEMLLLTIDTLMGAEADAICGAEYRKRSSERVNTRNGYRPPRAFDTRLGTLDLLIPKLRKGSYYPSWLLEPRKRSERALMQVISEAWVEGVSTRKMDRLVKALGITGISRSKVSEMAKSLDEKVERFRSRPLLNGPYRYLWLDATVVRCRECGSVENVAVVVAVGVNDDGLREVLGVEVFTSEDETSWTAFLRDLVERGLSNVLSRLPGKAQGRAIAQLRSVSAQTGAEAAREQYDRVADRLTSEHPRLTGLLDDAREEVLSYTRFPLEHWRKRLTNNPLENLNSRIKRRTRVVGIFPDRASVIRLVGMVLLEQHEDWMTGRRYMNLDSLRSLDLRQPEQEDEPADTEGARGAEIEPECVALHTPR